MPKKSSNIYTKNSKSLNRNSRRHALTRLASLIYANCPFQARAAQDKLEDEVKRLQAAVDKADNEVFGAFCRKIGITSIRVYEDRQLKVAQEESDARLRFDTQISRLKHQYVVALQCPIAYSHCVGSNSARNS